MRNTSIEWGHHTFNPWWGCMKVSEGCKNCYAENMDRRYYNADPHWGPGSSRKPQSDAYWQQLDAWNRAGAKASERHRVFCASMADVFEGHPDTLPHLERLFLHIADKRHLDFLLLTKRPENIMKLIPDIWKKQLPDNVWVGTSVENQEAANKRIPHLLHVPAKVRFLSCEPLLEEIDLIQAEKEIFDAIDPEWRDNRRMDPLVNILGSCDVENKREPGIHWVIAGGESGQKARPMHPNWVKKLRDQCNKYGIPFFFKQWGEWQYVYGSFTEPGKLGPKEVALPDPVPGFERHCVIMKKVGKKNAGRKLEVRTWDELPNFKR